MAGFKVLPVMRGHRHDTCSLFCTVLCPSICTAKTMVLINMDLDGKATLRNRIDSTNSQHVLENSARCDVWLV